MYTFRALEDPKKVLGTSPLDIPELHEQWFTSVEDSLASGEGDWFIAKFRGSLQQLFGEPVQSSTGDDETFIYVIEASDQQGNTWVLTACLHSSGPYIGGVRLDTSNLPAAHALFELIQKTPPADYEQIIYSDAFDVTVTFGCQNGACYWREVPGNQLPE